MYVVNTQVKYVSNYSLVSSMEEGLHDHGHSLQGGRILSMLRLLNVGTIMEVEITSMSPVLITPIDYQPVKTIL